MAFPRTLAAARADCRERRWWFIEGTRHRGQPGLAEGRSPCARGRRRPASASLRELRRRWASDRGLGRRPPPSLPGRCLRSGGAARARRDEAAVRSVAGTEARPLRVRCNGAATGLCGGRRSCAGFTCRLQFRTKPIDSGSRRWRASWQIRASSRTGRRPACSPSPRRVTPSPRWRSRGSAKCACSCVRLVCCSSLAWSGPLP